MHFSNRVFISKQFELRTFLRSHNSQIIVYPCHYEIHPSGRRINQVSVKKKFNTARRSVLNLSDQILKFHFGAFFLKYNTPRHIFTSFRKHAKKVLVFSHQNNDKLCYTFYALAQPQELWFYE